MSVIDFAEYYLRLARKLRQYARVATSRLVGTTAATDGKYLFALNVEEARLFHRSELDGMFTLLLKKKIINQRELDEAITDAMEAQLKRLGTEWPEVKVADDGASFSLNVAAAHKRSQTERWPP